MLKTQLNNNAIKTDPRVIEFAKNETPGTLVTEQLNTGRADFYYKKARESFGNGKIKTAFEFFKKALKFRNDIDTEYFERFIEIQGKRLFNFKQKNASLKEKLQLAQNENSEAKECIEIQTQKLADALTKISMQNLSIEEISFAISAFENETKQLKKRVKQLDKKLSESQIHSNKIETKLHKTESDLRKKKKENQSNIAEIKRLKNLKWYHKIIGRK